jgi:hypothetical protein
VGSAGVSVRQAPFAGSDRQARGRILAVVGQRPLRRGELASVTDREAAQALAVAESLVADGLCHWRGGELHLGVDDARVDCVGTDHVGTGQVGVGDVGVGESPRRSTRI